MEVNYEDWNSEYCTELIANRELSSHDSNDSSQCRGSIENIEDEGFKNDQLDGSIVIKPTFKSLSQAKRRLQAFSPADKLKSLYIKEDKVEDNNTEKEKPKKKEKPIYHDDYARSVIQEIEAEKRAEACKTGALIEFTKLKIAQELALISTRRSRSRSGSPDIMMFRKREIKCRSNIRSTSGSYSKKSPSPEDRSRKDNKPRSSQKAYPKNWIEYKEQNLNIEKDAKLKSKLNKNINGTIDLKSYYTFNTPSKPIEPYKCRLELGEVTVPFSHLRSTSVPPKVVYSVNWEKFSNIYIKEKELSKLIPKEQSEIIQKVKTARRKYNNSKATVRNWYPKNWKKGDNVEGKLLEKSVGLSFLQTYSDDEDFEVVDEKEDVDEQLEEKVEDEKIEGENKDEITVEEKDHEKLSPEKIKSGSKDGEYEVVEEREHKIKTGRKDEEHEERQDKEVSHDSIKSGRKDEVAEKREHKKLSNEEVKTGRKDEECKVREDKEVSHDSIKSRRKDEVAEKRGHKKLSNEEVKTGRKDEEQEEKEHKKLSHDAIKIGSKDEGDEGPEGREHRKSGYEVNKGGRRGEREYFKKKEDEKSSYEANKGGRNDEKCGVSKEKEHDKILYDSIKSGKKDEVLKEKEREKVSNEVVKSGRKDEKVDVYKAKEHEKLTHESTKNERKNCYRSGTPEPSIISETPIIERDEYLSEDELDKMRKQIEALEKELNDTNDTDQVEKSNKKSDSEKKLLMKVAKENSEAEGNGNRKKRSKKKKRKKKYDSEDYESDASFDNNEASKVKKSKKQSKKKEKKRKKEKKSKKKKSKSQKKVKKDSHKDVVVENETVESSNTPERNDDQMKPRLKNKITNICNVDLLQKEQDFEMDVVDTYRRKEDTQWEDRHTPEKKLETFKEENMKISPIIDITDLTASNEHLGNDKITSLGRTEEYKDSKEFKKSRIDTPQRSESMHTRAEEQDLRKHLDHLNKKHKEEHSRDKMMDLRSKLDRRRSDKDRTFDDNKKVHRDDDTSEERSEKQSKLERGSTNAKKLNDETHAEDRCFSENDRRNKHEKDRLSRKEEIRTSVESLKKHSDQEKAEDMLENKTVEYKRKQSPVNQELVVSTSDIKVEPDWEELKTKRKRHKSDIGREHVSTTSNDEYTEENKPVKKGRQSERNSDKLWEKDSSGWEQDDSRHSQNTKKGSWESDEDVFERDYLRNDRNPSARRSLDLEIPLNIKPFKKRELNLPIPEILDPDMELQILKRQSRSLNEERRRLEIEKQRVKELELELMRETKNDYAKSKYKKETSSREKVSEGESWRKRGRWDKKAVDDVDMEKAKREKTDKGNSNTNVSNTSATLENEYEEFIKAVSSTAEEQTQKSRESDIPEKPQSISSDSEVSFVESPKKEKPLKKKEKSLSKIFTNLDDLLPKSLDSIPLPPTSSSTTSSTASTAELKPVPVPSPQVDEAIDLNKPTINFSLSTNITQNITLNLASSIAKISSAESIPLQTDKPITSVIKDFKMDSSVDKASAVAEVSLGNIAEKDCAPERLPTGKPLVFHSMVLPSKKKLIDKSKLNLDDSDNEDLSTAEDKKKKRLEEIMQENNQEVMEEKKFMDDISRAMAEKMTRSILKTEESHRKHSPPRRSLGYRPPSPRKHPRSPSPRKHLRSPSPRKHLRSPSPRKHPRSPSPRKQHPRSPSPRKHPRSPSPHKRKLSPHRKSPVHHRVSPGRRSLSPRRRSLSPRRRSKSPRRRSKSPRRRSPKRIARRTPSPRRWRRSMSPRKHSPRRHLSPRPKENSPNRAFPEKPRSVERKMSPKRSAADSTISDDMLTQKNQMYDEPPKVFNKFSDGNYESPKRLPLDVRINQVLGLSSDTQSQQAVATSDSGFGHNENKKYPQAEFGQYSHSEPEYKQPVYNIPVPITPSVPKPKPKPQNIVQVGNMLQIMPTVDFCTTSMETPKKTVKAQKYERPENTKYFKQVGNVLHIVPSENIPQDVKPLPVPEPVTIKSECITMVEKVEIKTEVNQNLQEVQSAEDVMKQKTAEMRAERERRRLEREKKRIEKERRRKEKEKKRQIKLKMKTETMIKKALELEEANSELNLNDAPVQWPPVNIIVTHQYNKEAGKSILMRGSKKSEVSFERKNKIVQFADGIKPGEGTSPSAGEELSSPPPPKKKLPKEKRYNKIAKAHRKKKVKVKIITKKLKNEESEDEDNLPPPSPPPGSPPPHLWPARIKTPVSVTPPPPIQQVPAAACVQPTFIVQGNQYQAIYRQPLGVIMAAPPPPPPPPTSSQPTMPPLHHASPHHAALNQSMQHHPHHQLLTPASPHPHHPHYQQAVPPSPHPHYQQAAPPSPHPHYQQQAPPSPHPHYQQKAPPSPHPHYQQQAPPSPHPHYQQQAPPSPHPNRAHYQHQALPQHQYAEGGGGLYGGGGVRLGAPLPPQQMAPVHHHHQMALPPPPPPPPPNNGSGRMGGHGGHHSSPYRRRHKRR